MSRLTFALAILSAMAVVPATAFDAAAATAAALNVVEPYMSGLAGQGLATCYIARERRVRSLNFMGAIPRRFPLDRLKQREQLARVLEQDLLGLGATIARAQVEGERFVVLADPVGTEFCLCWDD